MKRASLVVMGIDSQLSLQKSVEPRLLINLYACENLNREFSYCVPGLPKKKSKFVLL